MSGIEQAAAPSLPRARCRRNRSARDTLPSTSVEGTAGWPFRIPPTDHHMLWLRPGWRGVAHKMWEQYNTVITTVSTLLRARSRPARAPGPRVGALRPEGQRRPTRPCQVQVGSCCEHLTRGARRTGTIRPMGSPIGAPLFRQCRADHRLHRRDTVGTSSCGSEGDDVWKSRELVHRRTGSPVDRHWVGSRTIHGGDIGPPRDRHLRPSGRPPERGRPGPDDGHIARAQPPLHRRRSTRCSLVRGTAGGPGRARSMEMRRSAHHLRWTDLHGAWRQP